MAGDDAQAPADTPLHDVVNDLDRRGFEGQFQAELDGIIKCLTCKKEFSAADKSADFVTRLEGISDPADMSIVIPLECPHCRTRGMLISHYGPEASAEEAEVLAAFQRTPREGTAGITTPGIHP